MLGKPSLPVTNRADTAVASTVLRKRCCGTSLEQIHNNFRGTESAPRGTGLAMTLRAWAPECRRNSSGPRMRSRMSDTCSLLHAILEGLRRTSIKKDLGKSPHYVGPHCGSEQVRQASPLASSMVTNLSLRSASCHVGFGRPLRAGIDEERRESILRRKRICGRDRVRRALSLAALHGPNFGFSSFSWTGNGDLCRADNDEDR